MHRNDLNKLVAAVFLAVAAAPILLHIVLPQIQIGLTVAA